MVKARMSAEIAEPGAAVGRGLLHIAGSDRMPDIAAELYDSLSREQGPMIARVLEACAEGDPVGRLRAIVARIVDEASSVPAIPEFLLHRMAEERLWPRQSLDDMAQGLWRDVCPPVVEARRAVKAGALPDAAMQTLFRVFLSTLLVGCVEFQRPSPEDALISQETMRRALTDAAMAVLLSPCAGALQTDPA